MSGPLPVYLDFAATTPCDERVVEAMAPHFARDFGNPSNVFHAYGVKARAAVDEARARAGRLLGCLPQEIVWTSGATEANNLALRGVACAYARSHPGGPRHLVSAAHEHKSVLATCGELEREGWQVTYLRPSPSGVIEADMVEEALRDGTALVSVMAANNEIGTLNDVTGIGRLCRHRGVLFHCDATQHVGRLPLNVEGTCIDLLSFSAHKMYGPKGVGALFRNLDAAARIAPQLSGGGQENGLRSGTLNVPGIVGMGVACEIATERMEGDSVRQADLRDALEKWLEAAVPEAAVNGDRRRRLPNIASVTLPVEAAAELVTELSAVACSSGSACAGQMGSPSHVLRAIGVPRAQARNTLRLSLGRQTDEADIKRAVEDIVSTVGRLSGAGC